MPAFGVGGGENESLIEIVTVYRDEATAGMAATASQATAMGAAIQSASGIAEMSVADFQALGESVRLAGVPAGRGSFELTAREIDAFALKSSQAARTTTEAFRSLEPALNTFVQTSIRGQQVLPGFASQVTRLGDAFRSVDPSMMQGILPGFGPGAPGDGGDGGLRGLWEGLGGAGRGRGGLASIFRTRMIQRLGAQISQQGQQVLQATRAWAEYAAEGERVDEVMERIEGATIALNATILEQSGLSAQLGRELGEHLGPAYESLTGAGDSLRRMIIEADDSTQSLIATSTVAAGTFLTVSGGVIAAVGSLAILKILVSSTAATLGVGAASLAGFAGGLGLLTAATATAYVAGQRHLAQMANTSTALKLTTDDYDEYIAGMIEAAKESGDFRAATALQNDMVEWGGRVLADTREEFEAFAAGAIDAVDAVTMTREAVVQMAMTSQAMVPQAAAIFGGGARAREDIQNEILTKQREYEHALAEIEERGATERRIADLNRRGAELRRLELSLEEQKEATRRALGGIAISYIQAWAEAIGTPEAFAQAWMATGQAGEEFGMWTGADWQAAQTFMGTLGQAGMGNVPWEEAIAGAGIVADTVTVTGETVVLENAVIHLDPGDFTYLPLPGMKEWGDRSIADELATQGVRTRP